MKSFEFMAADGFTLHGRLYGESASCRSALLIAPAMGVPQRFYADFAQWMAAQGHLVMSFDYRGVGASRPAQMKHSLRGLQADIDTWAQQDASAALAWLDAQVPGDVAIHWLGHSLGGQIFGMVSNRERVESVVTIGVGTGYWLRNAAKARAYVWWLWYVVAPLAMQLYGYFPGKRLRKVGDLPLGVMAQWRRACLNPDYLIGVGGEQMRADYAAVRTPILSLSFTDDEYMSARNTADMHAFYASAPREMRRFAPQDVGARRIGHFGFFRDRFATTLWPQVSHWLAPTRSPRAAG